MQIRAITAFVGGSFPVDRQRIQAAAAAAEGIDYVAIGPARLGDDPGHVAALAGPLAAGQVFASVEIADRCGHLSLDACRRAAGLIRTVAARSGDGFGNLYLAALANCAPETPFFPASCAAGAGLRFALGECLNSSGGGSHAAAPRAEANTSTAAAAPTPPPLALRRMPQQQRRLPRRRPSR